MMKHLLGKDFTAHYALAVAASVNVVSTSDAAFDLVDDARLVFPSGEGIAKYANPCRKEVNVIHYELFFKSLPQPFQDGKKSCDLITYTSDNQHFLLNELTNTKSIKEKRQQRQ
jgi:hypothetical protein